MGAAASIPDSREAPSILNKAFDLLRAFDSQSRVMTLSELSRASNLPKSTVHRLLARLVELEMVESHRSGYKIGLGMFKLAAVTPAGRMRDYALPHLARLHDRTGKSVHFGVLRGADVVYLEKVARQDCPSRLTGVGVRLPAHCTALGKALLAYEDSVDLRACMTSPLPTLTRYSMTDVDRLFHGFSRTRAEGFAEEVNETQMGLASVAAPIKVHHYAIAAVSVTYPVGTDNVFAIKNAVRETAAQIAQETRAGITHGRANMLPRDVTFSPPLTNDAGVGP